MALMISCHTGTPCRDGVDTTLPSKIAVLNLARRDPLSRVSQSGPILSVCHRYPSKKPATRWPHSWNVRQRNQPAKSQLVVSTMLAWHNAELRWKP